MTKRKKRKSVYPELIIKVNLTKLFEEVITQAIEDADPSEWDFYFNADYFRRIEEVFADLDFHEADFMTVLPTCHFGILYAEPFDEIKEKLDVKEEDILNLIKTYHLKITPHTKKEYDEYILSFHNPTNSPLYRFFNKYKEDGYELNIVYSVNQFICKVEEHLRFDMEDNLENYGVWKNVSHIEHHLSEVIDQEVEQ